MELGREADKQEIAPGAYRLPLTFEIVEHERNGTIYSGSAFMSYTRIDLAEIATAHGAEHDLVRVDMFARDFLTAKGLTVFDGPGRGPDGGRNLIVEEVVAGVLSEQQVAAQVKEAGEATAQAEAVENAVYDLKAVNLNRKAEVYTRMPSEVTDLIGAAGGEVAAALASLRSLIGRSL